MNNSARLIAAAAAVVVVALIGYQLLIAPNAGGPPPTESPSPSPTLAPTATAAPSQAADVHPPAGVLEPGTRYRVSRGDVAFTFAVPTSGWESDGSFVVGGHEGSQEETDIWFYTTAWMYGPEHQPMTPAVFDDPCAHDSLRTFEASLAGQAEAFTSIPGTELISGPSDVTVDSRAGQFATIAVPANLGCDRSQFWLLFNAECGEPTIECSNYPNRGGVTIREWFIDVDGQIFNIRAQTRYPEASADLEAELQQIIDSIQFE